MALRVPGEWDAADESLKSFAHMAVAAQVGCSWCLDIGYFQARNENLDVAKASQVPRWRESEVFTPLERDVLEYAEAMTNTPPTVTDELSARLLGLAERLRHLPSELSGGQQQPVAIARALVKEPKVLLADEPTGNLDEDTRDEIISLLENLWRGRGLTLIVVTHDSWIARRSQRVAVMQNGKLSIRQDTRRATT